MNNAEIFLERIRVSWFGRAVGKAADAAAALLGQTLMIWLRLALYTALAYVAGVASTLLAASVARTWKVWLPSLSPV